MAAQALPGTGGGRRVVADPGGDRAARRKHARKVGGRAADPGRQGLSADVTVVDDLADARVRRTAAFAGLIGVELRATGSGGVMAVCQASHQHDHDGPHVLVVGSLEKPVDLGDLAHMVAEHRGEDLQAGICTCSTYPSGGAERREDDPGCPEHGWVAVATEKAADYDWLMLALLRKLGGEGRTLEPEKVQQAVFAALTACALALEGVEGGCRFHGLKPPDQSGRITSGCASCEQPTRVRNAVAALSSLAGSEDPWAGTAEAAS